MKKCAMIACVVLSAVLSFAASAMGEENSSMITIGNARFTVISKGLIRLEYSASGRFVDEPSMFAVNRKAGLADFKKKIQKGLLQIDTGNISLEYIDDGKPFREKNLKATIIAGGKDIVWKPGMANAGNLGGTIRTVDGVGAPVDLGEGALSRDGWYLLDDSKKHLLTSDWVMSRPVDAGTDWYLFGYGSDYKSALRDLTLIGGAAPLPRKYQLGSWYSRYWPYTSDEYRGIVNEYDEKNFPLDVMVLDMDWHKDGWTGWSINRKLLPDFEDLAAWFHQRGVYLTLNVHPADGVGPHEDMYEQFMKDMGADPAGKPLLFDAADKKYLDTLFKDTHVPLEKSGVDFWWLDWQQYPFTRGISDLTNLAWLNHYYYKHTSREGKRGASFSRWAGWGDHRHPVHFSGDSFTNWEMLAFMVPFTSTAGNVGCFFWSHDIGGHMGGRNEESYTRWTQFGSLTAAVRMHSTRSAELDRRPWKYPEWVEESARIAMHTRSELFPYIYSSAWRAHTDSLPLNRPMYLEYPNDERSYRSPGQFFYGDSLLAAPVVSSGVGEKRVGFQTVWFPEGKWYNWFTGERYEGDAEAVVAADIDEYPLYAKGGAPVPMQPYSPRMATAPLEKLVVRCYPGDDGAEGTFELYEDDGETDGYLKGEYATTKLTCARKGDSYQITVYPTAGKFKGQLKKRSYAIQLAGTAKASKFDGPKGSVASYDEKEMMNIVEVPETPISEKAMINIVAKEVDFAALRREQAARRAALADISGGNIGDSEFAVAALAAAAHGAAFITKNDSIYYYNGETNLYFYPPEKWATEGGAKLSVVDVSESGEKVVAALDLSEAVGPVKLTGSVFLDGLPRQESETSRRLKAEYIAGGKTVVIEKTISAKFGAVESWKTIGPFKTGESPESLFGAITEGVDYDKPVKGAEGVPVVWRGAKTKPDGTLDMTSSYVMPHRSVFTAVYIYSKEEQPVKFHVDAVSGAGLWLNGEDTCGGNRCPSTPVGAPSPSGVLKKGANFLLARADHANGDWLLKVVVETNEPIKFSTSKK